MSNISGVGSCAVFTVDIEAGCNLPDLISPQQEPAALLERCRPGFIVNVLCMYLHGVVC